MEQTKPCASNTLFEGATDEQIALLKKDEKRKRVIKHTPNLKTRELQAEICLLRLTGMNFSEIGAALGIRPQHAHEQHRRAMQRVIQEPAQEVRELEVRRLDDMLKKLNDDYHKFFPLVNSGQVVRDVMEDEDGEPIMKEDGRAVTYKLEDIGPRMAILDRMLKIMERRAKLLGLDAPVRRTLEGADGGPVKFDHNSLRGLSDVELTTVVTLLEKAALSDTNSTGTAGS